MAAAAVGCDSFCKASIQHSIVTKQKKAPNESARKARKGEADDDAMYEERRKEKEKKKAALAKASTKIGQTT